MSEFYVIGEVAMAMGLGGLIGFEREQANKPAGLRTHMLVAGAAALLVALGDALVLRFGADSLDGRIRSDPIRIVEAVVTGISFLGAGTIFRQRGSPAVEGLTTAASMLITGSIGIAVALGRWWTAGGVTLLALAVLRGASWFEWRMKLKQPARKDAGDASAREEK